MRHQTHFSCPQFMATCIPLQDSVYDFSLENVIKNLFKFHPKKISSTFVTEKLKHWKPRKLINNTKTTSQYLCYLFNCSINNNLVHSLDVQQQGNKNIFECIFLQNVRNYSRLINLLPKTLRESAAAKEKKAKED